MNVIGNYLCLLIVLFIQTVAGVEVQVTCTDMHGRSLVAAQQGVPFLITTIVKDSAQGATIVSRVASNDHYFSQAQGRKTIRSFVNGVQSTTHEFPYVIRIDTPGIHKVGPVVVEQDGKQVYNQMVQMEVCQQTKEPNEHNQPVDIPGKVHLSFDHNQVIVGQKVLLTVRIEPGNGFELRDFDQPDCSGFEIRAVQGPFADGQALLWRWELYPKQAGNFVVGPINVRFVSEKEQSRAGFWGNFIAGTAVGSNQTFLTVTDPAQPIQAVGSLADYTVTLSSAHAKEHEGIVLTMSVSSDGAVQDIVLQPVVPDGIRVFPSKSVIKPLGSGRFIKYVEFIVQPSTAGEFSINAHDIAYYDPADQQYKSINAQPVMLIVDPAPEHSTLSAPPQEPTVVQEDELAGDVSALQIVSTWSLCIGNYSMSWCLFWLLVCLPVIAGLAKILWVAYEKHWNHSASKKRVCARVVALLKQARARNDQTQVHGICVLLTPYVAPAMRQEWDLFIDACARVAFSGTAAQKEEDLFVRALCLVDCIKRGVVS